MTRRVLALTLLAFLAGGVSALAHANYVKSTPDADAHLARAPTEVRISFSERPELRFSEIQVLDVDAKRVDTGAVELLGDAELRVGLQAIGNGGYTVAWKVLSAVDGHETRGAFAFAVGDAPLPQPAEIPVAPPPGPLEVVGRALSYLGVALLLGAMVFARFVALRDADRLGTERIALAGAASLLLGTVFLFAQSGGIALLGGSRLALLYGGRAAIALAALFVTRREVLLALGVAAAATLTLGSHAAASGDLFQSALDLVHVLAVSSWAGSLVALAFVALPRRRATDTDETRALGALVARFSTLGIGAVAVIVATGVLQSLQRLLDSRDLVETDYGLALLAKILLLAVAVGLASLNLLRHGPRLLAAQDSPRTRRLLELGVRGEVTAVTLILVAASVLTALSPPNAASGAAYHGVAHSGSVRVELETSSILPGQNRYLVLLREGLAPLADVEKVSLRFTMVEHDMGVQELVATARGDGEYVATGSPMAMFGTWRTEVIVRRSAHEDATALFTVSVIIPTGATANARVVRAGTVTFVVFSDPILPAAARPLTLSLVAIDPAGNFYRQAKIRATLEGKTYDAVEETSRYRVDLPALTAGNKTVTLTITTPQGDLSADYTFSVSP